MNTSPRRVRHEIADGIVLMGFSQGVSIGLALLIALGLGLA